MDIFVTGLGCVSCIGLDVRENLDSLMKMKSGIKPHQIRALKDYLVGEVSLNNQEIKEKLRFSKNISRTALLGMLAAQEAFQNHLIDKEIRTGIISGTSVGGIDFTENEYFNYLDNKNWDKNAFSQHDSGLSTEHIARFLNINDFVNTISTACSSAANAIMMGARMLENNLLDRVLVGGTDSLSIFTIQGFNSLMIYNKEWCKPFDMNRKGLNLGEGAGYIVLENKKSLQKTNSTIYAKLSGWYNASDAYHQTASSPDGFGSTLSMKKSIENAKLQSSDIDYINAHGTGTENNDLSESIAMKNVFGDKVPPFSSTKSYTGHTLAASAGIESVYSILAIQNKVLFPNLNFSESIEESKLTPQKEIEFKEVKHVLTNAFGFGGNNSTLIFSEV
ncbi:MAG: beta-ketoacyl-[acyl-carrier-protein] synthase family protein [Flavobacteriia bacterium]|nr:beta-ketoacyl-[acyl-carrier-protein] synthase family protein [Flavobacteriia bacterium]